ncbi:hypothetical protein MKL26_00265 [Streptococcus suis]|nr:hypothetical protein [Streptococcus suis]
MQQKYILISLVAILIFILGGCGMTSQKETLTKEQQDNVVKRIIKEYDIERIEFTNFNKDLETGMYHLLFTINDDPSYSTGLTFNDIERVDNYTDEIGLSPINIFDELKRDQPLTDTSEVIDEIKIVYLEE